MGIGGLAMVGVGAWLVSEERLDSGLLPLATLLAMASFLPISEISHTARQLADTLGATRRVFAVHSERVQVEDGAGVAAGAVLREPQHSGGSNGGLALEMDRVTFSYETMNRAALNEVSFGVETGKTLALVGPSGAGKTTAAHLFLRFWDAASGSVRIDGADLREYRLGDLRDRIALVSQDTYLFNASLRHNVLIARPEACDSELSEAIKSASLTDFVDSLPEGLDTVVGERGTYLSGGQRQRVAIARAFLKDAPILILDEATSHLDALNERAVRNALDALKSDRTTLVIAHRLSTVREADTIVVMSDGHVAETGSHEELMLNNGLYVRLVATQVGGD
jgi:ABC-type multidrug transport system fused ATPase/permease subunit